MDESNRNKASAGFRAGNNSDTPFDKVSSGAHTAVNSFADAADEAARKAKPAIDKAAAFAHSAVNTATSAAAPAANWLAEHAESLNAAQKKLQSDSSAYISAHPMKALGMAIVVGLLLGRVLR